MNSIYLDYNATTPLHPKVAEKLAEVAPHFANPASAHSFGQDAELILTEAKETIASFLKASPEELMFTSGGTESNNTVLFQLLAEKLEGKVPRKFICTSIEHSSILEYSSYLKKCGIEVEYLSVDSKGFVNQDELKEKITKDSLVSIIFANNEIGTIQDIEAIGKIVKEAGAELHVDATQAVGKIDINLKTLPVNYLTAAAHKIYGPRGVGLLYKSQFTKFSPFIRGGGQQEELRAGTENQQLIAGFAEAMVQRKSEMADERARLLSLRTKLIDSVAKQIPSAEFNGAFGDSSLAGTINMTIPGVQNEMLLLYLDIAGVAISTGSACSSRSFKASQVLQSIGRTELEAFQSIRVSMGRETTEEHVNTFISELVTIYKRLSSK